MLLFEDIFCQISSIQMLLPLLCFRLLAPHIYASDKKCPKVLLQAAVHHCTLPQELAIALLGPAFCVLLVHSIASPLC